MQSRRHGSPRAMLDSSPSRGMTLMKRFLRLLLVLPLVMLASCQEHFVYFPREYVAVVPEAFLMGGGRKMET